MDYEIPTSVTNVFLNFKENIAGAWQVLLLKTYSVCGEFEKNWQYVMLAPGFLFTLLYVKSHKANMAVSFNISSRHGK